MQMAHHKERSRDTNTINMAICQSSHRRLVVTRDQHAQVHSTPAWPVS
jgi:hypothetical protein